VKNSISLDGGTTPFYTYTSVEEARYLSRLYPVQPPLVSNPAPAPVEKRCKDHKETFKQV